MSLREKLQEPTRETLDRLARLPILAGPFGDSYSRNEYERLLAAWHGLLAPAEERLFPAPPPFAALMAPRARFIEADLTVLRSRRPTPRCKDMPEPAGLPSWLGVAYALDHARTVIAPAAAPLLAHLGDGIRPALAFVTSAGEPGRIAGALDHAVTGKAAETVHDVALQAFAVIEGWMAGRA